MQYSSTRHCHWKHQGIFLSVDEYNQIHRIQGERCALCGEEQSAISHALCVEHNHNTGSIRGLVCKRCNNMIAWIEKHNLLDSLKQFLDGNVFEMNPNIAETDWSKELRSK